MILFFLRHGQAGSALEGPADHERPLDAKGRAQARHAAHLMLCAQLLPEIVLTSPLLRARQTAELFTHGANLPGPIVVPWLSSGMSPETALAELGCYSDFERVMIVGHEPDLSCLIARVLGLSSGCVELRKGALAAVECTPPKCGGTLLFLLPYKLSKHSALTSP